VPAAPPSRSSKGSPLPAASLPGSGRGAFASRAATFERPPSAGGIEFSGARPAGFPPAGGNQSRPPAAAPSRSWGTPAARTPLPPLGEHAHRTSQRPSAARSRRCSRGDETAALDSCRTRLLPLLLGEELPHENLPAQRVTGCIRVSVSNAWASRTELRLQRARTAPRVAEDAVGRGGAWVVALTLYPDGPFLGLGPGAACGHDNQIMILDIKWSNSPRTRQRLPSSVSAQPNTGQSLVKLSWDPPKRLSLRSSSR
jgi:hypothetical protein